jgi:hypothetical protein
MSPTHSILDDPEHWRQRAEKARAVAQQLNNPTAKAAMLGIAEQYERQGGDARRRALAAPKAYLPKGVEERSENRERM